MSLPLRTTGRHVLGSLLALAGLLASPHAWSATQCINQNAPAPLEICVQDDGTPGVWVQQPDGRMHQYYSGYSWGSSIQLGSSSSQQYASSYLNQGYGAFVPVSNTTAGSGTAADPYVITTVLSLGATGVRFTQRFRYVDGDRYFAKIWTVENTGATSFADLRFFHGGDTYFGGADSARSWYDPDLRMVYVNNAVFNNSGYMAFYANPLTPHSRYHAGAYWAGRTDALNGNLSNTADSGFLDAGYFLQWNRAHLHAGESWRVEAFETWSPPGSLQVLSPGDEYVSPGTTVRKTFKVHNLSASSSLSLSWSASDSAGWGVSLPEAAAITLAPLQVVAVPVDLHVPAGVMAGENTVVSLNVTDGALNASIGSTRARIPVRDYAFTTDFLQFGSGQLGAQAELAVTFMNGSQPVSIGQVGASNPLVAPFSVVADTCSNASVAAGANCMITVRFTPTVVGEFTDSLGIPVAAVALVDESIAVAGEGVENPFVVTTVAGEGGSVTPTSTNVLAGATATFTLAPDSGYRIGTASGCNGTLEGNIYTTGAVLSDCVVTAGFARIAVSLGGSGTVPGGQVALDVPAVYYGDAATFTLTPDVGYRIATVSGCAGTLEGHVYTTAPITGTCDVAASFERIPVALNSAGPAPGGRVMIAPSAVYYGDVVTVTLVPDHGYVVAGATGCPGSLQANAFITSPLAADCTLSVSFVEQIAEVSVEGKGAGGGGSTGLLGLGGLLLLMLRRLRAAGLLAAIGFAAAASAQAGETREYHIGASLGRATSSESRNGLTHALRAQGHDASVQLDDIRASWRLHAGWSLSRHLGAEVGYSDLGRVRTAFGGSMPVLSVDRFLAAAAQVQPRTANGFDLSLVGRYTPAFAPGWSVQARAGVFRWDSERSASASDGRVVQLREEGANLLLGAGVVRSLTQRVDVAAEWLHYQMGDDGVQAAGLGLRYRW